MAGASLGFGEHQETPGSARVRYGAQEGRQWNTLANKGAQGSTSEGQGAHRKHWESARECQGSARERQGAPEPLRGRQAHKGATDSAMEHQGAPGFTRGYQGAPGSARVCQGAPGSTTEYQERQGALGSTRERQGDQGARRRARQHPGTRMLVLRRLLPDGTDGTDGRTNHHENDSI